MGSSFRALVLIGIMVILGTPGAAQVDLGRLQTLYQDMRSGDPATRFKAAGSIQADEQFLKYPETPNRFLALLEVERREIDRLYASGEGYGAGELYASLLSSAWNLWKDKLTPEAFRVFAEASYNPGSRFARELGARAGRFLKELIPLTTVNGEEVRMYTRSNATAVVGYALAADQEGTAPLTPVDRAVLIQALTNAAASKDFGVRAEAVRGMKLAGGEWALPVLQKMYEREASFDPSGKNAYIVRQFREEISAAMETVRSRAAKR